MTGEARRALVIAEARECFAERGYHAASMREIAKRAGITVPVLYDHFSSKKELHLALLQREGGELIDAVSGPFPARTAEQFMRASVDAFFSFLSAHPLTWRLLFADSSADHDIALVQETLFGRAVAALTDLFALTPRWELSAVADHELATQMLAQLTRSALSGLAGWWWGHRDVPREQVVATVMDLLWRGLGTLLPSAAPEFEPSPSSKARRPPRRETS